jgi:hypothetical protein
MKVEINRQLLGLEDQLFGVGTVTQTRNGEAVIVTRINAANLPFDEMNSLKEVIDSLTNLNLVATHITSVDLIGANIADVVRTANNIDIVVLNLTNIDIVASSIGNVNNTGNNISNINIVGNDLALAGYDATIDAGLIIDPIINTTSGFSNIEVTADNIADVQTVALYINDVIALANLINTNNINYRVYNGTASTITKGIVVKLDSFVSPETAIRVIPVSSINDEALGIILADILPSEYGTIITNGELTNIDTSSFVAGNKLYNNGSSGFTTTKPTTGYYQVVGTILQNEIAGSILLSIEQPTMTVHEVANSLDTVNFEIDLGGLV